MAGILDPAEWLAAAKATPVGRSRRIVHLREGRANLAVYNSAGEWSAYCHRCHKSGRVDKKHVVIGGPLIVSASESFELPKDIQPWQQWDQMLMDRVVGFLHSKGMALILVHPYLVGYSVRTQRLVFDVHGVIAGRDLSGRAPSKWLKYSGPAFATRSAEGNTYALVEDLFSMLKVAHAAAALNVMCCLGTTLHRQLKLAIPLEATVIGMFDGDSAGMDAANTMRRELPTCRILGGTVPPNLDPKDMSIWEIQKWLLPFLR